MVMSFDFYPKVGGWLSSECLSFLFVSMSKFSLQVGVFSPSTRSHYLNITPNNVVCVYSKDSDGKLNKEKTSVFKQVDFIIPTLKPVPKTPMVQSPGNQGNHVSSYIAIIQKYIQLASDLELNYTTCSILY